MTTSGASTATPSRPGDNIVLLGRPCGNTGIVAAVLQDAGIDLAAVILADPDAGSGHKPVEHEPHQLYRAPSPRDVRRLLQGFQPDLVIAACYPWRLSCRARATARCGFLNIHPSSLPQGRGPDPIFWVYRNGQRETGVTIHLMDDGLDTGPILAQQRMPVPAGMDAVTLERHLFEIGASMAVGLVSQVLAGAGVSQEPQDELAATYQPAPSAHDWIISPLLPAAWAWRFVEGVAPLNGPLAVQLGGRLVPVRRAITWGAHGAPPEELPARAISIPFRPGWVVFET